ncbi:MAG: hypothetical protein JRC53_05450 [Deltaproteobacteria bacterium]|nr:hypothetical protein [Deltaproteobacteria bacterium]
MELYEDENIRVTVPAATARAINVAAAANNKLLIISSDPILEPLIADGVIAVEPPCPCGNYKIQNAVCICQIEEINKHTRDLRIKYADYMWCENPFCFARDIKLKGLDEMGKALLKQAYQEFTPTVMQIVIILKSARAIANMEKSKKIEACHIAEGIAYRLPKD